MTAPIDLMGAVVLRPERRRQAMHDERYEDRNERDPVTEAAAGPALRLILRSDAGSHTFVLRPGETRTMTLGGVTLTYTADYDRDAPDPTKAPIMAQSTVTLEVIHLA